MMNPHLVKTCKCAVCGTLKQEANGWLIHVWSDSEPLFGDYFETIAPALITLPFRMKLLDLPNVKPLCGPGCANKDHQEFMESLR